MKKLGLEATGPYANVCGFDSKGIKFYDLIEGLELHLANYPDFPIIMDIIFFYVPNALGIILCREWDSTLGGSM